MVKACSYLDRKGVDLDNGILLLLAVLVGLHSLQLPREMDSKGGVHDKTRLREGADIAFQFRRSLALLADAGAAFPGLETLSSSKSLDARDLSRNIRGSTR